MAKKISNETRSTTLKKFKPTPNVNGGLSIGTLVDVNVSKVDISLESPMESFRGLSVPRLNFVFESRLDPPGVKKSNYIHSYLAIEHTPESVSSDGAWKWDSLTQTVKHFLDVYRDGKLFTDEEVALMTVDFVDVDKHGVFVEQPAEVVAEAYTKFFENLVKMFHPDGKAIYRDTNGKDIPIWMKLLLDVKGRQVNNGDYGFSGFPGEGLIEIKLKDVQPSLSINIAKGENIIPSAPMTRAAAAAPTSGQGHTVVDETIIPPFLRG